MMRVVGSIIGFCLFTWAVLLVFVLSICLPFWLLTEWVGINDDLVFWLGVALFATMMWTNRNVR